MPLGDADDPGIRVVAFIITFLGAAVGLIVLHSSLGLFQWPLLTAWLLCTIVLALRLLRVTKATRR